ASRMTGGGSLEGLRRAAALVPDPRLPPGAAEAADAGPAAAEDPEAKAVDVTTPDLGSGSELAEAAVPDAELPCVDVPTLTVPRVEDGNALPPDEGGGADVSDEVPGAADGRVSPGGVSGGSTGPFELSAAPGCRLPPASRVRSRATEPPEEAGAGPGSSRAERGDETDGADPDTPEPDAAERDARRPDAPEPDAPEPDAPGPDAADPDASRAGRAPTAPDTRLASFDVAASLPPAFAACFASGAKEPPLCDDAGRVTVPRATAGGPPLPRSARWIRMPSK